MAQSHTELRILKLARKGLSVESIARKIGRPGPEGIERVEKALGRAENAKAADPFDR